MHTDTTALITEQTTTATTTTLASL